MKIEIELPKPHPGQERVIKEAKRFNVLECGRRFGKTSLGQQLAIEPAVKNQPVAWFAPTYKFLAEPWREINSILFHLIKSVNKVEQRIELITGGVIDFWSLDNPNSGRGRKYKRVIIDEASIIADMEQAWQETIRPTLTDLKGDAWFLGTPRGRNFFHRLFAKGESGEQDWQSWRMGTRENPFMPKDEIEAAKRELPEAIFNQEYLGIPADDGGNPFGLKAIHACIKPPSTKNPKCFGVDLAKSQDWTVVIGLDEDNAVCIIERWQSDWGNTRSKVLGIVNGWPCLCDSTGVGDPIVEDMQRVRPNVKGYHFTSTSKQQLMEGLTSAIQQGTIGYPDGWLVRELESFEYEYTRTGVKYNAPSGMYDDGVCALALAYRNSYQSPLDAVLIGAEDKESWTDERTWH